MTKFVFRKKSEVQRFLSRWGQILSICCALLLSACGQTVPQQPLLSGHLLITGSTALQPLATIAATAFEKAYPQVRITVNGGGSLVGLNAVTARQVDIGASDIYADPLTYPEPELTDHIICIVPFAIIANADVPLASIAQQQLIDIFSTGKLQNWQALGGPNQPIVPIVRSDLSGTRASFIKYILNGRTEQPRLKSAASSQSMLDLVAHTPGAIGYLALSTLNASVHVLAINGVSATSAAIASGKYAFWGYEHMYTMNTNTNPLLARFLSFMLTAPMQAQAKLLGYIPLAQIQFPTRVSSDLQRSLVFST